MKLLTVTGIAIIASASIASAEGWYHANAGMGQHEGGIELEGGASLTYSCSGLGAHINMAVTGMFIEKGPGTLAVDGTTVLEGNVNYSSMYDRTVQDLNVRADYGATNKSELNAVIRAIQGGNEAVWTTPSGDIFTFDLTGSSDIKNCIMY